MLEKRQELIDNFAIDVDSIHFFLTSEEALCMRIANICTKDSLRRFFFNSPYDSHLEKFFIKTHCTTVSLTIIIIKSRIYYIHDSDFLHLLFPTTIPDFWGL